MIIWKIKGLVEEPQRTPGCSIWARFSIHQGESGFLNLLSLCHSFSSDGRNAPTKLKLYLLGISGAISCWDCTEDGKVNPRYGEPSLELNFSIASFHL